MSAPFRQSNRPGNLSAYEARKLVEPALLSVLFLSFYLIVCYRTFGIKKLD